MKSVLSLLIALTIIQTAAVAEITLPSVFSDHMVLQRNQKNPIWGTAKVNETITISIAGETVSTKSGKEGKWRALLPALPGGGPHTIKIQGSGSLQIEDVLVGEVWFCSGQSNMAWSVSNSYGAEVEIASANHPQIRLLTVERYGTDVPQDDIRGAWQVCSPETIPDFSAVGYFYGRILNAALNVPIGLIDNAWGGSSAEAWVPREILEADGGYAEMLKMYDDRVANFNEEEHEDYKKRYREWVASGRKGPAMEWGKIPHPVTGQFRPSNIFNGMVHPLAGYGIKGVIWYQGESNVGRAEQYLDLFPLMVNAWRDTWQQGDFPFYWVQLADFGSEVDEPGDNEWAELRDTQTRSMDVLPNSGQAVIIDIGEGRDIHPRDKRTVARRLARWPLARDYGFDLSYQSPRYKSMELIGNKILITLDHVSEGGLRSFDTSQVIGFSVAGANKEFKWAEARIVDQNTVEVWSEEVVDPVAVRYGWAQNPRVNLYDRNGLPVTPFRTDDWEWITAGIVK